LYKSPEVAIAWVYLHETKIESVPINKLPLEEVWPLYNVLAIPATKRNEQEIGILRLLVAKMKKNTTKEWFHVDFISRLDELWSIRNKTEESKLKSATYLSFLGAVLGLEANHIEKMGNLLPFIEMDMRLAESNSFTISFPGSSQGCKITLKCLGDNEFAFDNIQTINSHHVEKINDFTLVEIFEMFYKPEKVLYLY